MRLPLPFGHSKINLKEPAQGLSTENTRTASNVQESFFLFHNGLNHILFPIYLLNIREHYYLQN